MTDTGTPNGSRARISVPVNVPSIAALFALTNLVVFVAGYAVGYQATKEKVTQFALDMANLQAQISALARVTNEDRLATTTRLTTIEADLKYMGQSVNELHLYIVPKK